MNWGKIKSEFIKNVLTMVTGTTIAQFIPVLISPILTRLYSPDDFAIWTIYISIFSILEILGTGRFEYALLLPKRNHETSNLGALLLIFNFSLAIVVVAGLFFWGVEIKGFFKQEISMQVLWALPIGLCFYGFNQLGYYWLNREKKYKPMAFLKVSRSLLASLLQLLFGALKFAGFGLVLANVLTLASIFVITLKLTFKDLLINSGLVSKKRIGWAINRRKDFPTTSMLHALTDKINSNGTNLLIGHYYPSGVLGFYGLTLRVIRTPVQLVGVAISEVFYQRISEKCNEGKSIFSLVKKVALALTLVGFPVFLILYFFAPSIMGIVFGEEWYVAGEYASILCPWMFLNFIVNPLSSLPLVLKKQRSFFLICLLGNTFGMLSFIYGGVYLGDVKDAFGLFTMVMCIYMLVLIGWFMIISRNHKFD